MKLNYQKSLYNHSLLTTNQNTLYVELCQFKTEDKLCQFKSKLKINFKENLFLAYVKLFNFSGKYFQGTAISGNLFFTLSVGLLQAKFLLTSI